MISQAAYPHSLLPPKPVHVPWRLVEWPRSKVKVRGSVSSQSSMPSETWNSSRPEESIESRRYTFGKIGKANIVTRRVAIAAANIIRKSGWEHLIPQQADTQTGHWHLVLYWYGIGILCIFKRWIMHVETIHNTSRNLLSFHVSSIPCYSHRWRRPPRDFRKPMRIAKHVSPSPSPLRSGTVN